jgi:dihydropteroate synthase
MIRYRPVAMTDPARPDTALPLAGGWCWFDRVEVLERGRAPALIAAADLPEEARGRLSRPRPALAGLGLDRPRLMGILNVTPDSFSDGGRYLAPSAALAQARRMAVAGAEIIDIGGESTRPGATPVAEADEIARTAPVIEALREAGLPLSIDTRKAAVAAAALAAGAGIVNDVSGLRHDPALAGVVATSGAPVVLVHALGEPATMQADPRYNDVLLDVFDDLAERVAAATAAGIAPDRIVVDPGIGFGKTVAHNLALLRRLSLFHDLGLPLLLGASRKRFIGSVGGAADPDDRLPGSLAVALAGAEQGVQILRVHDVGETRQALALWQATRPGEGAGDRT